MKIVPRLSKLMVVVVVLAASCQPVGPGNPHTALIESLALMRTQLATHPSIPVNNPGRVHNQILASLYEASPRLDLEPVSRLEFATLFAGAANTVLAKRQIADRFTESDVMAILQTFDVLKREGVYDFYGDEPSDPGVLLAYLRDGAYLSPDEFRALRPLLAGTSESPRSRLLSGRGRAVASVYAASKEFWSKRRAASVDAKSKHEGPSLIDWYSLGIVAADAAGIIIIDIAINGGSTVTVTLGGALASAAFIALATSDDDSAPPPIGGGGSGGGGGGAGAPGR